MPARARRSARPGPAGMTDELPHVEIVNRTGRRLVVEAVGEGQHMRPRIIEDGQTDKLGVSHTFGAGVRLRWAGATEESGFEAAPAPLVGPPLPRDMPADEWAERCDLGVRSANCLRNERLGTLGEIADAFGPDLLRVPNFGKVCYRELGLALAASGYPVDHRLPAESAKQRKARERRAERKERDAAIFEACERGARTISEVAEDLGISAERVRLAYYRECRRRFDDWHHAHPGADLECAPITLNPRLSGPALRHLLSHGVGTLREVRELHEAGNLDRLDLKRDMRAGLLHLVADEQSATDTPTRPQRPHRPAARIHWAPHVRTPDVFGVVSEHGEQHFGLLLPALAGAGYTASAELRQHLEAQGVTAHAWPSLDDAKRDVRGALERGAPRPPAGPHDDTGHVTPSP